MNSNIIHVWQFPVNKIYLNLEDKFRKNLIDESLKIIEKRINKGRRDKALVNWLYIRSKKYGVLKKI